MQKPRFLDFFAGSGLVTEALRKDFDAVWANDFSAKKAQVYQCNHRRHMFDGRSIENVRGAELPDADLAWASFPCQDLSLAGKLGGIRGERSGMVWEWLRVINEMGERRPPVIAIENVIGLISAASGDHYRALHRALQGLGYKAGAMVLDAELWIPHSRPRVFVVAVPQELNTTGLSEGAPNWLHNDAIRRARTGLANWVWWRLPHPPRRELKLDALIEW